MDKRTLVFTGGGTGGHVYPGLAIAKALRGLAFSGRIAWIGSTKNSDREAVEAAGFDYYAIPSGKLRREFSLKNFADAFRVISGYAEALRILKALEPVFLFSKGGYVSVPPCAAAASLGIPYYTHESDLTPGLATRLNARRADTILLSYEQTREFLAPGAEKKAMVMGNPVRPTFHSADPARGRALLGVTLGQPILFFLGGSQGARQINELVAAILPRLGEATFVVHQTGDAAVSGGVDNLPPAGSLFVGWGLAAKPEILPLIAGFIAVFFIVFLIIKLIARLLEEGIEAAQLGGVDRILGLVLGLAEGLILVSFLVIALSMLEKTLSIVGFTKFLNGSAIVRFILPIIGPELAKLDLSKIPKP